MVPAQGIFNLAWVRQIYIRRGSEPTTLSRLQDAPVRDLGARADAGRLRAREYVTRARKGTWPHLRLTRGPLTSVIPKLLG